MKFVAVSTTRIIGILTLLIKPIRSVLIVVGCWPILTGTIIVVRVIVTSAIASKLIVCATSVIAVAI